MSKIQILYLDMEVNHFKGLIDVNDCLSKATLGDVGFFSFFLFPPCVRLWVLECYRSRFQCYVAIRQQVFIARVSQCMFNGCPQRYTNVHLLQGILLGTKIVALKSLEYGSDNNVEFTTIGRNLIQLRNTCLGCESQCCLTYIN